MPNFKIEPIVKEETTKERVYRQIKSAILNRQIPENEIFTEVQLADMLQTSRTPVREAVLDLSKEGLIVTLPRKGMQVRKITTSELEQIFLLRSTIEREVIKKLTETITNEQLETLNHICQSQEEAMKQHDNETFIQLDQEFHLMLAQWIQYELVEQVLLNLHDLSHLIGLQAIQKENRMQEVLHEHLDIIKLMKQRNPLIAADRMMYHLEKTRQAITILD